MFLVEMARGAGDVIHNRSRHAGGTEGVIHGIPEQVVTDNGSQFMADAIKVFMDRSGHTKCALPPGIQLVGGTVCAVTEAVLEGDS